MGGLIRQFVVHRRAQAQAVTIGKRAFGGLGVLEVGANGGVGGIDGDLEVVAHESSWFDGVVALGAALCGGACLRLSQGNRFADGEGTEFSGGAVGLVQHPNDLSNGVERG